MIAPVNAAWAEAFVDELVRAGVRHVCISPGSRSTPLTLAVAARPELGTSVHIDERSAGFFALGYGRVTGMPAALVCTSGTAAANYLPAVVEASMGRVPLIVLTADRPPELRDTGAWQAIDQFKLYGGYVRWFAEVATPSGDAFLLRTVRSLGARAVAVATGRPAGPVHLNFPFREPLAPEPGTAPPAAGGRADGAPIVRVPRAAALLPEAELDALAARIAAEPRGLILAGPVDPPPGYAAAIARLAAAGRYPILAEPAGALRFGPHDRAGVVVGYDAILRDERWAGGLAPGLVVRFGASLTWKVVAEYLARHPDAAQVVVDPEATWDDPGRLGGDRLAVDAVPLCHALTDRLEAGEGGETPAGEAWRAAWRRASRVAEREIARLVEAPVAGTVGWVYPAALGALPDGALVVAANSMAVRDLDSFAPPTERALRVVANRGAAGIDGTISTALGAAHAAGGPAVLFAGDLAFLHDAGGLGAAVSPAPDLTVVVLNDGGGGIFAYLPVAAIGGKVFERYFRTPPGADLAALCAGYGVGHARAADPERLVAALRASVGRPGTSVIEVPIDLEANTSFHRRWWADVAEHAWEAVRT